MNVTSISYSFVSDGMIFTIKLDEEETIFLVHIVIIWVEEVFWLYPEEVFNSGEKRLFFTRDVNS